MVFGAMYGLSTVGLYAWLGNAGLPTFYDKLLQVPLMNLSVKGIDWAFRSTWLRFVDPARLWSSLVGRRRYLVYVSVWASAFVALNAVQGVGDRHPGQWLPFWQRACDEGRSGACRHLTQMYETYCRAGSSWACREFDATVAGVHHAGLPLPPIEQLPILLRGSKAPIVDTEPSSLRARSCAQGWTDACAPVGAERR